MEKFGCYHTSNRVLGGRYERECGAGEELCVCMRMVKLYKWLCDEKREYVLSKQLLRSGTSIGANVEEAVGGISDKDFTVKMAIAYKEAERLIIGLDYCTTAILSNTPPSNL